MALTCRILVIYHEGNRTVCIIIDTIIHTFRKFLGNELIRLELLCLILIVCSRAELVVIVALGITVSCSYDHCKLGDRSLAALEVLANCRLELEFPRVVCYLLEMYLLIGSTPIAWNIFPLSVNNDTEVSIEFTGMSIEWIV